MLGSAAVVEVVASKLREYGLTQLVLDPVLAASDGATLLADGGVGVLREKLLPLALVVTPNVDEAGALVGRRLEGPEDVRQAAKEIVEMGARNVVIKGGDATGPAIDLFFDGEQYHEFGAARVDTTEYARHRLHLRGGDSGVAGEGRRCRDRRSRWRRRTSRRRCRCRYPLGHGHGPVHHFFRYWQDIEGSQLAARAAEVRRRPDMSKRTNNGTGTQMSYARGGIITEQMRVVAEKEGLEPELVRQEVAAGRLTIPANVNHAGLSPIGIGSVASVKINANIGNSALSSDIETELCKLQVSVNFGADTVMDLSSGGDIDAIREAIIKASPLPVGTVPIYQVAAELERTEDMTVEDLFDMIEHQARAGRRLHDGALRHPARARPAGAEARDGHRQPRRRAAGAVDDAAQSPEPALRALRRPVRHRAPVRRDAEPRRRPAPGLAHRRQRRGAVRRAGDAGRADASAPGRRTCR